MSTAQVVIDAARRLINDEATSTVSGQRVTEAELLDWITDAQREIVALKPEANARTEVCAVTADESRQRITTTNTPGTGTTPLAPYRLIRVECNTDDTII